MDGGKQGYKDAGHLSGYKVVGHSSGAVATAVVVACHASEAPEAEAPHRVGVEAAGRVGGLGGNSGGASQGSPG